MARSAPLRTLAFAVASVLLAPLACGLPAELTRADVPSPVAACQGPDFQGPDWTPEMRDQFYSLDQGSRIMPLRWIRALKRPDGSRFMADALARYGYLPNEASPANLPVGFNTAGEPGEESIGMTCAACHTRQIEVAGTACRIDGGPAIVDFQGFVSDLDVAVGKVLEDAIIFADFAREVLGSDHSEADEARLRKDLSDWYFRYHTLMSKSLPQDKPWGPGRVDAVAMIFNRVTGLDLGLEPPHVIEDNIQLADAPVRYPFLWNAAKQDRTQWPGFALNDSPPYRMARNVGQVLGVFAEFLPRKDASGEINYWAVNSTNIEGLKALEILMTQIGPPRWPWALDEALAEQGEAIFERECRECHGSEKAEVPWPTPRPLMSQLKTDRRELELLNRKATSGVLAGQKFPFDIDKPLEKEDTALRIVSLSVVGSLVPIFFPPEKVKGAFRAPDEPGYEARVLQGVWAAAPYLHNGSVPTLADLLKPASERPASFKIGSAYDPVAVGLATEQTQFGAVLKTTDCSDRDSGNSRCGHEGEDYGTTLSQEEKRALLEYLKKL